MWSAAKQRAKKENLPFNIEVSDIVVPKFCPVLGIELKVSNERNSWASPSLDKTIPELGYVKGNIEVISKRANLLKNNATVEEVEKLLDYMKQKCKNN